MIRLECPAFGRALAIISERVIEINKSAEGQKGGGKEREKEKGVGEEKQRKRDVDARRARRTNAHCAANEEAMSRVGARDEKKLDRCESRD